MKTMGCKIIGVDDQAKSVGRQLTIQMKQDGFIISCSTIDRQHSDGSGRKHRLTNWIQTHNTQTAIAIEDNKQLLQETIELPLSLDNEEQAPYIKHYMKDKLAIDPVNYYMDYQLNPSEQSNQQATIYYAKRSPIDKRINKLRPYHLHVTVVDLASRSLERADRFLSVSDTRMDFSSLESERLFAEDGGAFKLCLGLALWGCPYVKQR